MYFHVGLFKKREKRSTRQRQRSQDAAPDKPKQDIKPKPGVDVRAAKGEGHIMCEMIKTLGSIAKPGKTRVFPPWFSRTVNTFPTLPTNPPL
jgi:hypothetical protein